MNVRIEKLVYGGEGLGHFEDSTVFVPFVMPGEVVAVRAVERRKKFVRGRVQHLITPSAERTAAPCPHFAACGGCDYQHIPYESQVAIKAEILRETLSRLGRVKWEGEIRTHAGEPYGYRNRAQWKIRAAQAESDAAAKQPASIGYHRAGSSAILPVTTCPILAPRLEEILQGLRGLLGAGKLPAAMREIEAFCDHGGEKSLLNVSLVSLEELSAESVAVTLREALPGIESVLVHESSRDRFELFGPGFITYRTGEFDYRVGHLSFFQVNRFLVDALAAEVARDVAGALALDLFAGVGLFTLPLARQCERVIAVESNEAAARDLQTNIQVVGAAAQGIASDVEAFLRKHPDKPGRVVVDPPRAGLGESIVQLLLRTGAAQITYVSCDPATLARDLGLLTGAAQGNAGVYRISEVQMFDLFPQSFHIETLVKLEKV